MIVNLKWLPFTWCWKRIYTVKEVANELSIHPDTLYRWISEYEEYGESAFPGRGSALYNSQYEMKKLFN